MNKRISDLTNEIYMLADKFRDVYLLIEAYEENGDSINDLEGFVEYYPFNTSFDEIPTAIEGWAYGIEVFNTQNEEMEEGI